MIYQIERINGMILKSLRALIDLEATVASFRDYHPLNFYVKPLAPCLEPLRSMPRTLHHAAASGV